MPTPWKPDYTSYSSVGAVVDDLKAFIDKLFAPNHQQFRDYFIDDPNNPTLNEQIVRQRLASNRINIPLTDGQGHNIRIVIVDIENARIASYKTDGTIGREAIKPTDWFYLLVMPPVPRNAGGADLQTYESAWHHAIVDGYGM